MNVTPNLGLGKPLPGENYNIGVSNANMDTLDTAIGSLDSRTDDVEGDVTNHTLRLVALERTRRGVVGVPAVAAGAGIPDIMITLDPPMENGNYFPALSVSFQGRMLSFGIVSRAANLLQVRVNNYTTVASTAGTLYWSVEGY